MKSWLDRKFEETKGQDKALVENLRACTSFSVQLGVWISPLDNRSYLGVVVACIIPNT